MKRAAAKLPTYLQKSPVAISLLNDFAEALGWQVSPSNNVIPPDIWSIYRFGNHNWRVLDVQNGKALLLREKIWDARPYDRSYEGITTWANCTLRTELK